jgi:two-component system sensor histidine kinase PhoQ
VEDHLEQQVAQFVAQVVEIEDDGPGVEPEQVQRLLQRGQRGDERRDGQGLGLSIVRELVEANGGRLEVDRGELGGARFRVILPPR